MNYKNLKYQTALKSSSFLSRKPEKRPIREVLQETLVKAVHTHKAGDIDQAEKLYREVMKYDKQNSTCLHYLGVIAKQRGWLDESERLIKKALQAKPEWVDAYYNLALTFREQKNYMAAIEAANKGLSIDPEKFQILSLLSILYHQIDQSDKGVVLAEKAVKLNPQFREAWINLGINYYRLARFDEARKAYEMAIKLDPEPAEPYNNIGAIYMMRGLYAKAFPWFRKALEHNKKYPEAHNNIATCYRQADQYGNALIHYKKSLEYKKDFVDALCNLANIQRLMGLLDEAKETYEHVIKIAPEMIDNHCNYLMALHYMDELSRQYIYDRMRDWEKMYCTNLNIKSRWNFENNRDPDRKLRVGLVSGSFRRHPVGYMILPALENMDPEKVEWYGYSSVGDNKADDFTDRIREKCTSWKSLMGLTFEQMAELAREDQVDILIDLSGHSENSPLIAFAHRGAPVQVEWVGGLFDTSGIEEMDWIIGDDIEIPEGDEEWYTEKVYRMPDNYICYEPPEYAPEVGQLPALENGFVTFGNFNNLAKTTKTSVRIWARIMNTIPGSKLFLKTKGLGEDIVQKNIRDLFAEHGIEENRLIFAGGSKHEEHMQVFNQVDICLDPYPYTGGLTTCESLYMGVPVVTLPGPTFAGRHAATHLNTVGLDEWIVDSEDAYVRKVAELASDTKKLSQIRQGLREKVKSSPLIDGKRFAVNLEKAFRHMWHDWLAEMESRKS